MARKTAVLFLTHFVNDGILRTYQKLRKQAPKDYEVYFTFNTGEKPVAAPKEVNEEKSYIINDKRLLGLPYPVKCKSGGWSGMGWNFAGNADVLLLAFYRDHPEYDYVWIVEYDVHYEGNWSVFFSVFENSPSDLLGTCMSHSKHAPDNVCSMPPPLLNPRGETPSRSETYIGFFPIARFSNKMLRILDQSYKSGWGGHYELAIPTIAELHDLFIEDIGGSGPYVKSENKNRFYFNNVKRWDKSPGTFVFRPSIKKVMPYLDTLWHPVKPTGEYFNHCPANEGNDIYGHFKRYLKNIFYSGTIRLWMLFIWNQHN